MAEIFRECKKRYRLVWGNRRVPFGKNWYHLHNENKPNIMKTSKFCYFQFFYSIIKRKEMGEVLL